MKKLAQVFLAGIMVIIPFAVTIYLIWIAGGWIDKVGQKILPEALQVTGLGALIVIIGIFLVGLLAQLWIFRWVLRLMEKVFQRVPGVKTIYESVRDLLKLFGQESRRMGRVVLYNPPGTQVSLLAILTSENPAGVSREGEPKKVAIYIPLAYMIGGPVFYVPVDHVKEIDMPVEQALKLSTTAQVGAGAPESATETPDTT